MSGLVLYGILLGTLLVFTGVEFLIHKFFSSKEHLIVERIFVVILIAVYLVRFMSAQDIAVSSDAITRLFENFGGVNNNGFFNFIGMMSVWFEMTAMLFLLLRPFTPIKTAKWYVKFISSPIFLVASLGLLNSSS